MRLRLVCLPCAGGGGLMFRPWAESTALPEDVAICSVQLPGRENRYREHGYCNMTMLVEQLANVMTQLADLPFVLFGHSMGALIGFELARSLRRRRMSGPAHLIVSGANPPQLQDQNFAVRDLADDELISRVRYVGGTPEAVLDNPELVRLLLPTLRADFSMLDAYRWQREAPLDCPITVFGGQSDPIVPHAALRAWSLHTTAACNVTILPGDHFFIQQHRDQLLDRLGSLLNELGR